MGQKKSVFVRDATGLVKQITAIDALGMSLTGMGLLFAFDIIAFTPGFYPGANPIITQFAGLILTLPIGFVYVLFAIALPRAGGDYVWVSRILHPSIGFISNFGITLIILSFIGTVTPEAVGYGLGEWAYDLGKIYNNQTYLNWANYFLGQQGSFLISAIIILFVGAVVVSSVKLAKGLVRYITYFALVVGAIFVVVVLWAGSGTFQANFNSLSGANYSGVIAAGVQAGAYNGVPSAFTYISLLAGVIGVLSYLDFWFPAYFASELKGGKRSQIISQLGGLLIFAVFTTIIAAVSYYGEGAAFSNAIALLWGTYSNQFPYVSIPLASGMSMFWNPNPILVTLFNFGWVISIIGVDIAILFTITRNLFAWSFDRILPGGISSVNDRTHTPIIATVIMLAGGLIYCYIDVFNTGILQALFSYATAGMFISFIIVAIAAIVFPWRRKDIFQNSDSWTKKKVGPLPVITLCGVLSIIASAIVIYAVILPVIGSAFGSIFFEGIIPTFIIGLIVFLISWAYRRSQGFDFGLLQKEIPPE